MRKRIVTRMLAVLLIAGVASGATSVAPNGGATTPGEVPAPGGEPAPRATKRTPPNEIIDPVTRLEIVPRIPSSPAIDTVRRVMDLTLEENTALENLEFDRMAEAHELFAAIVMELEDKYLKLALEALPPEKREICEKALAVEKEYAEGVTAADEEYVKILTEAMRALGKEDDYMPWATVPRIRTHLIAASVNCSPELREQSKTIWNEREAEWRQYKNSLERPGPNCSSEERDEYYRLIAESRQQFLRNVGQETEALLTEEQSEVVDAMEDAMEEHREKTEALQGERYEKLIEILGKETVKRAGVRPALPVRPAQPK